MPKMKGPASFATQNPRGSFLGGSLLEVEGELDRLCTRRYVVCSAERREEIVQGRFVGQVDHGEAQAPLVAVAVEKIVMAHGKVK